MKKELRKSNYKFGSIHGKLQAKDNTSEAHIQRTVFLSQRIKIRKTMKSNLIIRIFAYEVPLEKASRGRCVDLMGYDKDHNLYLVELKKKESRESLDKVIEQIKGYAETVRDILPNMEKEFEETFFFPIEFNKINKMIIAPRDYFKGKKRQINYNSVDYGYFLDKNINERKPGDMITVHLQKK